jgi:hypothetical protein
MKILLGSQRHDSLAKAADWFLPTNNQSTLNELLNWAKSQETTWGDCLVFVEVDVPGTGNYKAANIDLIVAFSDRVAVCEVKNHRTSAAARTRLSTSLAQTGSSLDLINRHLGGARVIDSNAMRSFLFVPQLNSTDVAQLITQQLLVSSLRHVAIVGGAECRSAPSLPNGHPLYLPLAMKMRLEQIELRNRSGFSGAAQHHLHQLVDKQSVHTVSTLAEAATFLSEQAHSSASVRLPAWHIRGLRDRSKHSILTCLNSVRLVEVCGAFGIGKSCVVREALYEVGRDSTHDARVATITLAPEHSGVVAICDVLSYFDVHLSTHVDEPSLMERLLSIDGFVWIRGYDSTVRPFVTRLMEQFIGTPDRRLRLIIESRRALPPPPDMTSRIDDYRVSIDPLAPASIRKILERLPSGNGHNIVPTRLGNPRIAASRWQSPDPYSDTSAASGPDWSRDVFAGFETDMAALVVCLLDMLPCGVDLDVLRAVGGVVFPAQLPRISGTASRVLHHLGRGDFVRTAYFSTNNFKSLWLDLPEVYTTIVYATVPALRSYVHVALDETAVQEFQRRIRNALCDIEPARPELTISLAVVNGDFESFCNSTLGSGVRGASSLITWLEQRPRHGKAPTEELERVLRFADRLFRCSQRRLLPLNLSQLGERPRDSEAAGHLWDVAHATTIWLRGERQDLESVVLDLEASSGSNVACEALCWIVDLRNEPFFHLDNTRLFSLFNRFVAYQDLSHSTKVLLRETAIVNVEYVACDNTTERRQNLLKLYGEYFRLASSRALNVPTLAWMRERLFRMRRSARQQERDLALAVFADDGNINQV